MEKREKYPVSIIPDSRRGTNARGRTMSISKLGEIGKTSQIVSKRVTAEVEKEATQTQRLKKET